MPPRILLLGLLLVGCAAGESTDFVVYKAAPEDVDGRIQARSLIVLGSGRALGVMNSSSREISVRCGGIGTDEWDGLRTVLAAARHLRKNPVAPGGTGVFQIRAQLGSWEVRLARDRSDELETDVEEARDRLERIYEGLPVPADPVAALLPFLASPVAHARGQSVNTLLILRENAGVGEEIRQAADRAVRDHLAVEQDPRIVLTIRKSLER